MKRPTLVLIPILATMAACSSHEADAAKAPTFHEVMKDKIDVRADEVWAVGNAAIADDAGLDPEKMTDERWQQLERRSQALREAALEIATMDPIVVTRPGVKISDEGIVGGHSAAQVQSEIDKDPQALRDMAQTLAVHSVDLADAAAAHDIDRAALLINQLDSVCESCHLEFWYPDQKALVEQYLDPPG